MKLTLLCFGIGLNMNMRNFLIGKFLIVGTRPPCAYFFKAIEEILRPLKGSLFGLLALYCFLMLQGSWLTVCCALTEGQD